MTDIATLGLQIDTSPLDRYVQSMNDAKGASVSAVASFEQTSAALDKVTETSAKVDTALKQQAATQKQLESSSKDAAAAIKMQADAEQALAEAGDRLISKLQVMIETYNLTTVQVMRLRAAQLGVSEDAEPLIARLDELAAATRMFGKEVTDLADIEQIANAQMAEAAQALAQANMEAYAQDLEAFRATQSAKEASFAQANAELGSLAKERAAIADSAAGAELDAYKASQAAILEGYTAANAELESLSQQRKVFLSEEWSVEVQAAESAQAKLIASYEAANAELESIAQAGALARSEAYAQEFEEAIILAEKQAIAEIQWTQKSVAGRIAELDRLKAYMASEAIRPETINSTFSQAAQNDLKNYDALVQQLQASQTTASKTTKQLASDVTEGASAFDKLSFSNKRATTELITLGDEAIRGNYTRMASSFGGLIKAVNGAALAFTGMGAAALATIGAVIAVGVAFAKGEEQLRQLNIALAETNDVSGETVGKLDALAHSAGNLHGDFTLAYQAVNELAKSGKFTGDQIESFAGVITEYSRTTGESIKSIIDMFASLEVEATGHSARASTKIAENLVELDNKYHFLEGSILAEVLALEKDGNQKEAAAVATKALSDHIAEASAESVKNLGNLEGAWNGVSTAFGRFWQLMKDWGKDDNAESAVAKLQKQLSGLDDSLARQNSPTSKDLPGMSEAHQQLLEQRVKVIDELKSAQIALGATEDAARDKGAAAAEQTQQNNAYMRVSTVELQANKKALDDVTQRVQEYTNAVAEARKNPSLASSPELSDAKVAETIENMKKAAAVKGSDDRMQLLANEVNAYRNAATLIEQTAKNQEQVLTDNVKLGVLSDEEGYQEKLKLINDSEVSQVDSYNKILEAQKDFQAKSGASGNTERAKLIGEIQTTVTQIEEIHNRAAQQREAARMQEAAEEEQNQANLMKYLNDEATKIDASIEKQKEKNAEIGMSKEQIDALHAAQEKQQSDELEKTAEYLTAMLAVNSVTKIMTEQQVSGTEKTIQAIDLLIEKRKQLNQVITQGATKQNEVDMAKAAEDAWTTAGKNISQALTSAFGATGTAIGGMTTAFTTFASAQIAYTQTMQQLSQSGQNPTDPAYITQAQNAWAKFAEVQIKSYADMSTAAEGFFKKGTTGYKLMQDVSEVFHLTEVALELKVLAVKLTSYATAQTADSSATTASAANSATRAGADGTAAVAKTMSLVPYPYNLIAAATVIAALVAAGVHMAGGSSSSTNTAGTAAGDQALQGTGTVLGNSTTQSSSASGAESIVAANTSTLVPLTTQMLVALQSIQSAISGVINIVLEGSPGIVAGTNFGPLSSKNPNDTAIGGLVASVANTFGNTILSPLGLGKLDSITNALTGDLFGKSSTSVTDSGLSIAGTIAQLMSGSGISQYADTKTNSSSLFGLIHSSSTNQENAPVDSSISNQFALIFQGLSTTMEQAAPLLGQNANDIEAAMNKITVSSNISLKGLTGTALDDAINTVISQEMDQVATALYPQLGPFQQVGEGMAQTVVRVATAIDEANTTLSAFHITAVNFNSVLNKQGDVEAQIVQQSIEAVEQQNGVLNGVGKIIQASTDDAADLATLYQSLVNIRSSMRDTGLGNEDLNSDMINGAGGTSQLQAGLSSFLQDYFTPLEQAQAQLTDLNAQFTKLGVTMPSSIQGFRDLVESINTSTASGSQLQGQLLTLSDSFYQAMTNASALTGQVTVASATSDLTSAYNTQVDSINSLITSLQNFKLTIASFQQTLSQGSLSPLTPEEKYDQSKAYYESVLTQAQDTNPADATATSNAQNNLQSAAQAFLTASQAANASNPQYQTDFAQVQTDMTKMANFSDTQVTYQQQQLTVLNSQVQGLITINTSVLTVAQAIAELQTALSSGTATTGTTGTTGTSTGTTGGVSGGTSTALTAVNQQEVSALYETYLGRAPDSGALTNATALLNQGASPQQLINMIKSSPEYTVDQLYQSIFGAGKFPSTSDVQADVSFLKSGGTLQQLASKMEASINGSHSSGLDYVPFNGYLAQLHAGETVLTSAQATEYRQAASSMNPLIAEIRSLNQQMSAMRQENAKQTTILATATLKAAQTSGEIAAAGAMSASDKQIWRARTQPSNRK